jgi:hypothetical protein
MVRWHTWALPARSAERNVPSAYIGSSTSCTWAWVDSQCQCESAADGAPCRYRIVSRTSVFCSRRKIHGRKTAHIHTMAGGRKTAHIGMSVDGRRMVRIHTMAGGHKTVRIRKREPNHMKARSRTKVTNRSSAPFHSRGRSGKVTPFHRTDNLPTRGMADSKATGMSQGQVIASQSLASEIWVSIHDHLRRDSALSLEVILIAHTTGPIAEKLLVE